MNQRIGLYGGSFDPIHFGHLISARSAAEQLDLGRIILIPSARPPHKRDIQLTAPQHRLTMTRLAVEGDALFEVSDVELHRAGASYTYDTVQHFRADLGPSVDLFWIIGADSLPELPTWYRVRELVQAVRIVTAARPGFVPPNMAELGGALGQEAAEALLGGCCSTPEIGISSTEIRARVAGGLSIRYLVPAEVLSYIEAHGLYR